MSSPTDEKLLSLLHEITAESDLDLPTADQSNEIDNVIAEENAYTKKRSQEFLLTEMEQKLEIAELNFGTLKQQLDYMKMLYSDIHRESDKLDKQRKDRQKKRPQSRVKSICKTLPLRRRFSSASVHRAKNTVPERARSLNHKAVTYTTSASNTEEIYTASEPQSAKKKNRSPRKSESETQRKMSPLSEMPLKETEDLEELNLEPTTSSSRKEQNMNLFQTVCNQGQQTEPMEVHSAHEIKQDFWYGYVDDANQSVEQCKAENLVEENKDQQESFSCEPTEEEIEYTVLISANSKHSTNNSDRPSVKRDAYPKHMPVENPKKANKKLKGKQKRSVSQSTILTINPIYDGFDGVNKPKRKGKGHGGNTEKKRRSISKTSIQTRRFKPRITETVVSVTTKTINKKPSKTKLSSSKSTSSNKKAKRLHSRHKLFEDQPVFSYDEIPVSAKPNNNLVELYHNENVNVNISEENVPESSRNESKPPTLNTENQNQRNAPPGSSKKKHSARRTGKKETSDVKSNQIQIAQPKETEPKETVPNETETKETEHKEIEPKETVPKETEPKETVRKEIKPKETVRKEIKPKETVRKEIKPKETVPKEIEPKETKSVVVLPIPSAPVKEEKETLNILEETKTATISESYIQPQGPTRFKYFKRNYYKRLNFKKIPFVAGMSTSPSHNLGLNIQQVLSMIKMKQPHLNENITSHTQVVESSTFLQHTVHRGTRSICPAKMYGTLTEDPEQEADNSSIITQNTTNDVLFGLRNKIKRPEDVWVVDQDNPPKKPRCTCVPSRRCTDYQQLLIEYLEKGGGDISFLNRKYSQENYPPFTAAERKFRSHFSTVDKRMNQGVPGIMEQSMMSGNSNNNRNIAIQENGYNVKGVLSRLHSDFNRLNMQYKELQNGFSKDLFNREKQQESQKLERALRSKEHEINMIMDLYKEVSMDSWEE